MKTNTSLDLTYEDECDAMDLAIDCFKLVGFVVSAISFALILFF